jgi:DivIVA domain-containing protein
MSRSLEEGVMSLFGKRKRPPEATTHGYEPPPIEQMHGQPAVGVTPPYGSLTADGVRNVAFGKPPIGKRGYNEDEVDAFLDRIEAALRDPKASTLAAGDVHNVAFSKPPIGKRGYNEDDVDAFLDRVEQELRGK